MLVILDWGNELRLQLFELVDGKGRVASWAFMHLLRHRIKASDSLDLYFLEVDSFMQDKDSLLLVADYLFELPNSIQHWVNFFSKREL